jgi:hypothetical protein
METSVQNKLATIQQELKAPKGQTNNFGNYKYRSCEDILEAVKPLLQGATLVLSDQIEAVGNRVYVRAEASLSFGGQTVSVMAYAREPEVKKGMDESQITGAASSYARKYALNGLFCIDDTKDADTMDNSGFALDEIAQQWIAACRANPEAINQIEDKKYRDFIAKEMMK